MAGYIPAPFTLQLDGERVPSSRVDLRPGVGINGSIDSNVVQLDAPNLSPTAPASLYVPDVTAWPSGLAWSIFKSPIYLTQVEALISGAPPAVGTDPDNCYKLRIAGTDQGSIDVPLDVPGQRRFTFDANASRLVYEAVGTQLTSTTGMEGYLVGLVPTADAYVEAMVIRGLYGTSTSDPGVTKHVGILDSDRQTILTDATVNDSWGGLTNGERTIQFAKALELRQGVTYWMFLDVPGRELKVHIRSLDPSGFVNATKTSPAGYWLDAQDTIYSPKSELTARPSMITNMSLAGKPQGVSMAGSHLELSVITLGTPPAPAPTGVNVRFQWAGEMP